MADPQPIFLDLFHELKQRFPEVPDKVVKVLMEQSHYNRKRCIDALAQESEKYLYGDFTGGIEHSAHAGYLPNQLNSLHISVSSTPGHIKQLPDHDATGATDFRARSDSASSRTSVSSVGSNHAGATGISSVMPVNQSVTTGVGSNAVAMPAPATPQYVTSHVQYMTPGPTSAPVTAQSFEPFLQHSRSVPGGFPQIPCSVSEQARDHPTASGPGEGTQVHIQLNQQQKSNQGPVNTATSPTAGQYGTGAPVGAQGHGQYSMASPVGVQGHGLYSLANPAGAQGHGQYNVANPVGAQGHRPYSVANPVSTQGHGPYSTMASPATEQGHRQFSVANPVGAQGHGLHSMANPVGAQGHGLHSMANPVGAQGHGQYNCAPSASQNFVGHGAYAMVCQGAQGPSPSGSHVYSQAQPSSHMGPGAGWYSHNTGAQSNRPTPVSRPGHFPQSFPQGADVYSGQQSSPSPQQVLPSSHLPYAATQQQHEAPTGRQSPFTSPHAAPYGYGHSTPNTTGASAASHYPHSPNPPQGQTAPTYSSRAYIHMDTNTPPSGNVGTSVVSMGYYMGGQSAGTGPGQGSGSSPGTPTHSYTTQPSFYQPDVNHWRTNYNVQPRSNNRDQQSLLNLSDPEAVKVRQKPIQPILSPASSHGSLTNLDQPLTGADVLRNGGVPVSSAGGEDIAYTQALLMHQRARHDKLARDLEQEKKTLEKLRSEVGHYEQKLMERRRRNSNFATADDVQKMREENRRLQIDIQIMAREIDMFNNGQTPLGIIDPLELQNFYGNLETGQHVPIRPMPVQRPPLPDIRPVMLPPGPRQSSPAPAPPPTHPPVPPAAPPEPVEGEQWACSACTFLNHPALDKCECCEMPRIVVGHH